MHITKFHSRQKSIGLLLKLNSLNLTFWIQLLLIIWTHIDSRFLLGRFLISRFEFILIFIDFDESITNILSPTLQVALPKTIEPGLGRTSLFVSFKVLIRRDFVIFFYKVTYLVWRLTILVFCNRPTTLLTFFIVLFDWLSFASWSFVARVLLCHGFFEIFAE